MGEESKGRERGRGRGTVFSKAEALLPSKIALRRGLPLHAGRAH